MTNNKHHLQEKSGRGNAVTEFEERVWMHHQQNEDGTSQYSAAYHLIGKTNIGRLVSSISKLPQFVPSLNVCYQFDEDAGLLKSEGNAASQSINIEAVDSVQAAISHLQNKQSTPIILEKQSPIQFTVYICEEKEIVLGVISHQILNGEVSWKEIFDVLSSLYNHGLSAIDTVSQASNLIGFTPLSKLQDLSESRLPWIKRSTQDIELVQTGVSEDISSYLQAPVPRKFATSIQRNSYEKRFGRTMSEVEILAATAVLFARYISESNGLDNLDVFVPADISQKDHEINGSMIESGLTHLKLGDLNVDLSDAISEVVTHLNSDHQSSASYDVFAESAALVTWLVDPAKYLSFEGIEAKKLPVAPLHPKFEVSLGVGIDQQGELGFELVTGSSVSPHIGAYLFEQFIAYIGGERAAKPVVQPQTQISESASKPVMEKSVSIEDAILAKFQEALECEHMTKEDDFFDFGGHSLIGTRVIGRLLKDDGIEVPIDDLFTYRTAEKIAQRAKVVDKPKPVTINTPKAEAPKESVADVILAEFKEALATDTMTVTDDFFDFGGHSLIATRVIGRLLTHHGIEIKINDVFSYPTAQALAENAAVKGSEQAEVQGSITDVGSAVAPLSFAQNSLWKAIPKYAKFGLTSIFNLPFVLRFLGELDEVAFGEACRDLLVRHAGLRTHFYNEDGNPRQRVVDASEIDNYKWFWTSDECQIEDRDEFLKKEAFYPFDLEHELPLRVAFVRCKETGLQFLSFMYHHIVQDEWSINLLMDELNSAYKLRLQGKVPSWRHEALPMHEYARMQRSSGMQQQHLEYWLNKLEGLPWSKPIFPEDHPLSEKGDPTDSKGGWVIVDIDEDVKDGLYALAKAQSASLFNVCYASIAASLNILGAPDKMIVGTSASGRQDVEYYDTIGYFTTIVAHVVNFSEAKTVSELVAQVKNTINDSLPYADMPIDLIEEGLCGGEPETDNHIFEVFIQLHAKSKFNGSFDLPDGDKLRFDQVEIDRSESGLGLQFEVIEEDVDGEQVLRVLMSYLARSYSPAQVKLLTDTMLALFAEFAKSAKGDQSLEAIKGRVIESETV